MKPHPVPEVPQSVEVKFWERIDRSDSTSCWEYRASKSNKGYGLVSFNGEDYIAHRVSWRIVFGEIPDGMCVLHRCDNPPCCNPFHLRTGTQAENMRDMAEKRRGTDGEKSWTAKLTERDVREIRSKYTKKQYHTYILAKEYGVHPATIRNIIINRAWVHVK